MRRAWKILFALLLSTAATLASGQIYSSQSGLLCASPAGLCQVIRSYGFPLAWRTVVSFVHPQGYSCTGPLLRDCILSTYPPLRYNLMTFLLDTLFLAAIGYGVILFAGLGRRHLFEKLRGSVPSPGGGGYSSLTDKICDSQNHALTKSEDHAHSFIVEGSCIFRDLPSRNALFACHPEP